MLEKAKKLAAQEFSRLSGREIKSDEKCGDYAEVTHNGDKAETYVDVYAKVSNRAIED
ncbi:DUF6275 family protein [Streptococcus suis]|uniref:DUF6275 family protein n=1 Tax=Streptococcus suis TaxID=1307 RepID=UPI00240F4CD1|nr:DUF6275 family protein [Streptococcus suis]